MKAPVKGLTRQYEMVIFFGMLYNIYNIYVYTIAFNYTENAKLYI